MTRHVLYGVRNSRVDETAEALGIRLGCTFQYRESDYLGIYKLASVGAAEIKVVAQPDPAGNPLEDDFVDYGTLVYVEAVANFPELDGFPIALAKLVKLRVKP